MDAWLPTTKMLPAFHGTAGMVAPEAWVGFFECEEGLGQVGAAAGGPTPGLVPGEASLAGSFLTLHTRVARASTPLVPHPPFWEKAMECCLNPPPGEACLQAQFRAPGGQDGGGHRIPSLGAEWSSGRGGSMGFLDWQGTHFTSQSRSSGG